MISLPIYRDVAATVEQTKRASTTEGAGRCRRCSRWSGALPASVCIQPEIIDQGDGPTLLLVGERPSMHEDRQNRPFVGQAGALLRSVVADWKGKIVLDNALRCYVAEDQKRNKRLIEEDLDACRAYTRDTIELAKPERIIALGSYAAHSLLGRMSTPYSVRKAYSWLSDGTPVFLGINPSAALRNRFVRRWFEEDLRWAMNVERPIPTQWDGEFSIVRTPAESAQAVADLRVAKWFGFDIENSGVIGDEYYRVLTLAACPGGTDYPYVWDEQGLHDPAIARPLFDLLEDPTVYKTAHNGKHDMLALRFGLDVEVRGFWADSMLDRRVVQSDALAALDVASELVGMGGLKAEAERELARGVETINKARERHRKLRKSGVKQELRLPGLEQPGIDAAIDAACRLIDLPPKAFAYALLPYDVLTRYVALDALACTRLTELQRLGFVGAKKQSTKEQADRPDLSLRWSGPGIKVARDFMTEACVAYTEIEAWGVGANLQAMQEFNRHLRRCKAEALDQVRRVADVDPASADQVRYLLYEVLEIPAKEDERTAAGKAGTGKEILKRLADRYPDRAPVIKAILEYRRIDKLLGTYAEGFARHVRSDRRVHPNFKVAGTEAGRPSCEDPNMQNLPRPNTVEGKMSRNCFDADPGYVLIEGDYSQIELRVAAMLSGDRRMIDAYVKGEDLHWRTTQIISVPAWGIRPEDLDPEKHGKQRTESKVTTFGLLYGKTVRTVAKDLGIPVEQADAIVSAILGGYSDFSAWRDDQLLYGKRHGEIWTYWDSKCLRRRPLWQIGDVGDEPSARAITAQNSTVNTPIQGTASDFCLRSAIEIVKACKGGSIPARLIMTIHDANILECREEDVDLVIPKVREIMLSWPTWNGVPLEVDFKVGKRFGDLEKYKVAA